jgi:hypothetical protein
MYMSTAKKTVSKKTAKKTASAAAAPAERPVLVTTANRGVFFGYATDTDGETIKLRGAQLCVYWSPDMRGFMGLASMGPSDKCRVGKPCDGTLRNITAVLEVPPEAEKRWLAMPWST